MFLTTLMLSAFAQDCSDPAACALAIVPNDEPRSMGIGPQGTLFTDPESVWPTSTWTDMALGAPNPLHRLWVFIDGDGGGSDTVGCGSPVDDQGMYCWGAGDPQGVVSGAPGDVGVPFVKVDVSGKRQAVAIDQNGQIYAWGYNNFNFIPHAPTGTGHLDVSVAFYTGAYITYDGQNEFWGYYPSWVEQCEGFMTDMVRVEMGYNFVLGLDSSGDLDVCGNTAWTGYSSFAANVPTATDIVDMECNDTGKQGCVAWHSDGTASFWTTSSGTASDFITDGISWPGGSNRSYRSTETYAMMPKVTDDKVCGKIEDANGVSFWVPGQGYQTPATGTVICHGGSGSSNNQPKIISTCP